MSELFILDPNDPPKTGIRSIDQPTWSPPGGTSSNRYHEIARPLEAAFLAALRSQVETDDQLWLKVYNEDFILPSIYLGWVDDPRGSYYVAFGLQHQSSRSEDDLRSFSYLNYTSENEAGEIATSERVGESCIDPQIVGREYARDVELHVSLLLAWLRAHRRQLVARGALPS